MSDPGLTAEHAESHVLDEKRIHQQRLPLPLSALLNHNSSGTTSTSPQHHDLRSFLNYVQRTGLSKASSVYAGTRYEYVVQATLQRYGFDLVRCGGRGDLGVDLVGYWYLPTRTKGPGPLRVVVQCKWAGGKGTKMGPNLVRELEGAARGIRVPGWRDLDHTVGVLVGSRPATAGVTDGMRRSTRALAWVMLEEEGEQQQGEHLDGELSLGRVKQVLWNQRARELGLEGVDVVRRYDRNGKEEVVLMYRGNLVKGVDEMKEEEKNLSQAAQESTCG